MPTRLLAIGDIHLGRTLRRLPDGLDPARLGPAAALRAAVAAARSLRVSAVLLAGDVADQEHDLYHAHGVLTEVLGALGRDGIPVLAVAGNHDHETLPRLARALPDLQILGRGGAWETVTVQGDGGPVDVLGWSFPGPHHPASPALGLTRVTSGRPTLGLLHADLDTAGSRYAPVRAHELQAAGPVRWLLGHIHQPSLDPDHDHPGYLGSLVGLQPNETGPRGPWLVSVEPDRIELEHLAQAPLRWERLDVTVDHLAEPRIELAAAVAESLREFAALNADDLGQVEAVGVRINLVGRAADHAGLVQAAAELGREPFCVVSDDLTLFVDAITSEARPTHDLAALAERDDPPGLLARDLLDLAAGTAPALLAEARRELARVDLQGAFVSLAGRDHDDASLTARLLEAGYRVLDTLLASRKDGHGAA
ncbi:MAG: metallophosphoesterase [Candidatus Krumholzibacteriia bacterium]